MRYHIVGTRPQFIKLAAYFDCFGHNEDDVVIHTGQHYDYEMSELFFEGLDLPKPDKYLNYGGSKILSEQLIILMKCLSFSNIFDNDDNVEIIVYGDCITTLAGALYAFMHRHKLHHIEAGVRTEDRIYPEGWIRKTVDHLADVNYYYYDYALNNLLDENYKGGLIKFPNLQLYLLDKYIEDIKKQEYIKDDYILLTYHRRDHVTVENLTKLFNVLETIDKKIIFPCHPRTKNLIDSNFKTPPININIIPPLGYVEFIKMILHCKCVITDSGGVQCEAYHLGKQCIVLHTSTPWPHTLDKNILIGTNFNKIKNLV